MRSPAVERVLIVMGCVLLASCFFEQQHLPAFEVSVDGTAREYNLFAPVVPPVTAMPLVVAIHGGGGRGGTFPQQAEWEQLAEAEGVLLAFPQSEKLRSNEGEWQLNTSAETRHDLDFIEAVIDDVATRHDVDRGRVYAIGYSLGSMFVYELACHLSSRFAAFASFAGTMPVSPISCAPEVSVPIMHVHGADDGIIVYRDTWEWKDWDSVGRMRDIPSLVQFWSDLFDCRDTRERDTASSLHIIHDSCDDDVRVEHHRVNDAGHGWPDAIDGTSTHQLMWSFLSEF